MSDLPEAITGLKSLKFNEMKKWVSVCPTGGRSPPSRATCKLRINKQILKELKLRIPLAFGCQTLCVDKVNHEIPGRGPEPELLEACFSNFGAPKLHCLMWCFHYGFSNAESQEAPI